MSKSNPDEWQRPLDRWQHDALEAIRRMPAPKPPKPEKPLDRIHVLIDTREQAPWCFSKWCTTERVTLGEGEYSLKDFTGQLRIERKSLPDLVGSITTGRERFFAECQRLTAYRDRWLVIEATRDQVEAEQYRGYVKPSSVLGSVASLLIRFGVVPIWASDHRDAGRQVEWMLRKYQQVWRSE